MAILATGRSGWLAITKAVSFLLSTGFVFVLVPICQEKFANGGLGVMYALAAGEVLMFVPCLILLREVVDGRMVSDMLRTILAGAATLLLWRLLPALTPLLAIPMCVLVFGGFSFAGWRREVVRAQALLASFRR